MNNSGGAPIILCAINARYAHTSFGLRYLRAQLDPKIKPHTQICEYTISQNARDIVEALLKSGPGGSQPSVIGLGVYIWNTDRVLEVLQLLRLVAPEVLVILGGPEVSHETQSQQILNWCDLVFCGEADLEFARLLSTLFVDGDFLLKGNALKARAGLTQESNDQRGNKALVIKCADVEMKSLRLPYDEYTDADIAHRVLYVEASRGCPYKCEYCLSSLDKGVKNLETEHFLQAMKKLIDRGARQFKFVDRTFNLSPKISTQILEFFYEQSLEHELFLHFEMVPDRLPDEIKNWIKKFKPGALQFEIGIQTWNPQTAALVSRRQDYKKIVENLNFLSSETGVHMHTDLIAGLPGESLQSFAKGFDSLLAAGAQEIQVGILKRLKGTPIVRHDQEFGMVYQPFAPFQILKNNALTFEEVTQIARFSSYWDAFGNSGQFARTLETWKLQVAQNEGSFFWAFFEWSEFLYKRFGATHSIALLSMVEQFWLFVQKFEPVECERFRETLIQDYACGPQKRDVPKFLLSSEAGIKKTTHPKKQLSEKQNKVTSTLPKRQEQHAHRRSE